MTRICRLRMHSNGSLALLCLSMATVTGCRLPGIELKPTVSEPTQTASANAPYETDYRNPSVGGEEQRGKRPGAIPIRQAAFTVQTNEGMQGDSSESLAAPPVIAESPALQLPQDLAEVPPGAKTQDSSGSDLAASGIVDRPQAEKLPVEFFVATALAQNPKIVALQHRVASLGHRIPQVRALPDPMVQETFWPFNGNALETAGGRAANQIALSQQVPWPDKLRTKAAIAAREMQIAQAELEQAKLDVAEQVRLACLEIALADQTLGILDEFRGLADQINSVAEAKYRSAVKGVGQQDVLRAQLVFDRLDDQIAQTTMSKQSAQASLAAAVHQSQLQVLEVEPMVSRQGLHTQLDELIGMASAQNPALRGFVAQLARDREKQKLACLQQYPDFNLGVNWLIISDDDALSPVATGNDNFGFSLGVTLPVWKDKIRAGVAEAHHQTQSTAGLYASERDAIAARLRRLIAQFDALETQQEILVERTIPRTDKALEITLTDYAGNRADFTSVIDLFRERLALELQDLRLTQNQSAALIQLETLVGVQINTL